MDVLHIPDGINFECTGCGNCCLKWPVPITEDDRVRIEAYAGANSPLRALRSPHPKLQVFTHTLEKRADGKCEFLSEENRCLLHQEHGPEAKAAMCQLFPYTFNPTPSGVFASISFASTGALLNSGSPLVQQADFLKNKYELFKRLLPGIEADWSNTQLVDGQKLDWPQFMELDQTLMSTINDTKVRRVEKRLQNCGKLAVKLLPPDIDPERAPRMEANPRTVDWLILRALRKFYLPDDVFENVQTDFDARALLREIVESPDSVRLEYESTAFGAQQILQLSLSDLDESIEDLFYRFVYCRLFAKLYFGFGFANLSVIAGLHHLATLIVILRLELKLRQLKHGRKPDFYEAVELVRTLERRLTMANLSRESTAVLETLLVSPQRVDRFVYLVA